MPSASARATVGSNIANCSSSERLRLRRAKVSVALPKIAMCRTPLASARSRPRSLGTSTGIGVGRCGRPGRAAPRRRRAGAPTWGGRSWSPPRPAARRRRSRSTSSTLTSSGDDRLLVLQPVAGADLVDRHPRRQAGSATTIGRRIRPPARARVLVGRDHEQLGPERHLVAGGGGHLGDRAGEGRRAASAPSSSPPCTPSTSPSSTSLAPARPTTASTVPGIGAVTRAVADDRRRRRPNASGALEVERVAEVADLHVVRR